MTNHSLLRRGTMVLLFISAIALNVAGRGLLGLRDILISAYIKKQRNTRFSQTPPFRYHKPKWIIFLNIMDFLEKRYLRQDSCMFQIEEQFYSRYLTHMEGSGARVLGNTGPKKGLTYIRTQNGSAIQCSHGMVRQPTAMLRKWL